MRAWSSDMKDRTADVLMLFATLCAEGVLDILFLVSREAIDQSPPNIGLRFLDREKGAGTAHKVLQMRLDYDIQAVWSYCNLTFCVFISLRLDPTLI